jgi:23S rRNA (adenine2503-C2)-methyltransferase
VGDSIDDSRRLSRMLALFPNKVNLIPFNPWPGAPFRRSSDAAIEAFRRFLADKNHRVSVRTSRGLDIGAACGQLDGKGLPAEESPDRKG